MSDSVLEKKNYFNDSLDQCLAAFKTQMPASLFESVAYSLTQGGKRFRPTLILAFAEAYGVAPQRVLPWAHAIEMIHTYSLVHDDLPSMDNDDFRRGQPTNHKVYGEATAILAGDSMLTDAFGYLSNQYKSSPEVGLRLVRILSEKAGSRGMIAGQILDMNLKTKKQGDLQISELLLCHELKTGALMSAAVEGTAVISGISEEKIRIAAELGTEFGICFQLKDDLLDSTEQKLELGSVPSLIGIEKTRQMLEQKTHHCQKLIESLNLQRSDVHTLFEINVNRKI